MTASRTILIIDDNDDFRSMLNKMLSRAGYLITEAENGAKGVEAYRQHAVDLVITDLFMPEKDGTETARELKKLDPNVKIIAVSGGGARIVNVDFEDIMLEYGFLRILQKPFRSHELKTVVEELLR